MIIKSKMKLDQKTHKGLKAIYYDTKSPYGFSSATRFYKKAKKKFPKTTRAIVKEFFSKEETASRFRLARQKFKRTVFSTRRPNLEFLADLADIPSLARFNKGFRYILIIQDLFTKEIISLAALRSKKAKEVASIFEKVFKKRTPKILFTDQVI